MTYRWAIDNNFVKYYPAPTWQELRLVLSIYALYMIFTMGHRQQLCESIVQIQVTSENLWHGHKCLLFAQCDSDLCDIFM